MLNLCTVKKTIEQLSTSKIAPLKRFIEENNGSFKRWPIRGNPTQCNAEITFYRLGFMQNRELLTQALELTK